MTIRADREGRINVWPDHSTALLSGAATPLGKVLHKMTVYDHSAQAIQYRELETGPVLYHAPAVHFDGATFLNTANLAATDNRKFSAALWFKQADFGASAPTLAVVDPAGIYGVSVAEGTSGSQYIGLSAPSADYSLILNGTCSPLPFDTWRCLVMSLDGALGQVKIYLDRVDVTHVVQADTPTFQVNGLPFYVGSDTYIPFVGDMAIVRIAPGQSWLVGGDIPVATLDLFSTAGNKPVDPANATAALGAPAILFSGSAASFGTNQGTGGAFAATGALTDAGTSPSD